MLIILWSSHFCPQNQNNAKNVSQITYHRKDKTLDHSIKHTSKGIDIQTLSYYIANFTLIWIGISGTAEHWKNIGLWSRVHKIPTGVSQKAECHGKPWSFENRTGNRIGVLKHVGFRISATYQVVLNQCGGLIGPERPRLIVLTDNLTR